MQLNKLRVLDLFSGIGGFSLGLESTGSFETIAFVEKDKFCQQVLRKNFPNIPIEDDVRNVKGNKYKPNVITGGFPCQPFSVAGKRRGTDDDRYLWDETIRIVSETKPKWFIGENVEGIINIQNGMVFRQIHNDLESENYEVQSIIIPASGIGAWHQRKRVWIIGCNVSNSNTRFGIGENQEIQTRGNTSTNGSKNVSNTFGKLSNGCSSTARNSSTKFKRMECDQSWNWNEVRSKTKRCSEQDSKDVSDTQCIRTQVQTKRKHTSIKLPRSESTKSWWEIIANFYGVPNGVSYELDKNRSNRIKSLGNSIVPQIARELGKAIIEAEINI